MGFNVVNNGAPIPKETGYGYDEEMDWLSADGICHFSGPEAFLPVGGYTNVPGWGPEKAAYLWEVDDPDNMETGKALKKTKDVTLGDFITGVKLNEKTLKGHIYKIRDANGGSLRNPIRNKKKDELALVAIRNMRRILRGTRAMIDL